MATANEIVSRALRLIKVIAAGETIEAGIGEDSRVALNNLGQRWLASGRLAAWTDAAALTDTLVTPASANDALAYALAVKLAPEFQATVPEGVVALAAAEMQNLWRDRIVATSPTDRTAGALVLRALRLVSGTAQNGLPDTVSLPGALVALNAQGQRWLASGLIASWTDVAAVSDAVSTSAGQDEALVANLAFRLAQEYGIDPSPLAQAASQGVSDLWRDKLAPTGVTRTAGDLIYRALRMLDPKKFPDAVNVYGALTALNAIGQRWLASGLIATWADVDAAADALSTDAKADDVLVTALAGRLAAEYGMDGSAFVPDTTLLWRDRLAPTGVTRTAGDLIYRAMRLVSGSGTKSLPDSLTLTGAIVALNAIGRRWLASGLIEAWTDVAAVADAVSTDAGADDVLVALLAVRIGSEYGVGVAEDVRAAADVSPLWRDRLAPDGVTRTAGDLLYRALRLLSGGGVKTLPDNLSLQAGIVAMNAVAERWLADGLIAAWTSVAAIADAVSTDAKADDILVANVALRLAGEYGVALGDDVRQQATTGPLWRDRLTGDGVTTGTAQDVILRALRLLPQPSVTPDTVDFDGALGTLNAMLAEWHEAGIGLPDYSVAALSTPLASDVGDREAVAYQLAVRLAPEYGGSLSPEALATATQAMFRLRQRYLAVTHPVPSVYY